MALSSEIPAYRALTEGAAVVSLPLLALLEMRGGDRERFLNGQVTCEVAGLDPGRLTYGFFTDRKGKIQADVLVLALEDRFHLVLPAGERQAIAEHLAKYALMDRVSLEPVEWRAVAVVGPEAMERLGEAGVETPPEDGHAAGEVAGVAVRAVRRDLWRVPAVTLWVEEDDHDELVAALADLELPEVAFGTLEIARVERGGPRFGADFGPDNFPQETGIEDAVSYTKGCYLGQEVVARIHYRGGVNRGLVGLAFEGEGEGSVPVESLAGAELAYEGRSVGTVGTAVESPREGFIGLAVVHKRAHPEEGGTVRLDWRVETPSGMQKGEAVVTALPFVGS